MPTRSLPLALLVSRLILLHPDGPSAGFDPAQAARLECTVSTAIPLTTMSTPATAGRT
jgi:hypothetical protein